MSEPAPGERFLYECEPRFECGFSHHRLGMCGYQQSRHERLPFASAVKDVVDRFRSSFDHKNVDMTVVLVREPACILAPPFKRDDSIKADERGYLVPKSRIGHSNQHSQTLRRLHHLRPL